MDQLEAFNNGNPYRASRTSIHRWSQRLIPYVQTGNRGRSRLVGDALFAMVLYKVAFPDAEEDDVCCFIYDETGEVYERTEISKRMQELHMTQKRSSTEAYQAFTPDNMLNWELFWTCPSPLGVVGVERR